MDIKKIPLSEAEAERLAILTEEAGEVLQEIGKITRHGFDSDWPKGSGNTNRKKLEKELGHLLFMIDFMIVNGDISKENIEKSAREKNESIKLWLHHNEV